MSAPQVLMAFRAACAPVMFVLACFAFPGPVLAGVLAAGFLSDLIDGGLARRMGVATPALRYADTLVDTIFYVAAAAALAIAVPGAFDGTGVLLVALITIHVSRATFEVTKYGRVASYHMWSAQALGVLLAVAIAASFATGRPNVLLTCALWLAIGNELEGFAASAVLPSWRADVPSIAHALDARAGSEQRMPPRHDLTVNRLISYIVGGGRRRAEATSRPRSALAAPAHAAGIPGPARAGGRRPSRLRHHPRSRGPDRRADPAAQRHPSTRCCSACSASG